MGKGKKVNTVSAVWALAQPIAQRLDLDLWDVRFIKEGATWYLRIFIDKDDGVSIDDCEAMSRALDKPLDELDIINQSYCLEVSSPGIERELIRDEHFKRFIGSNVMVKLIRPNENSERELKGILDNFSSKEITLNVIEKSIVIDRKNIASVRLDDFGG